MNTNINDHESAVIKPLVIGSIYAPSELNSKWYELQKRFIDKTTNVDFDYKVILNGADVSPFNEEDILITNSENHGHSYALQQLIDFFRQNKYESYLILDSDCFPVWNNWYEVLVDQMNQFNKIVAAAVRAENLDLFPHPSVFFIRGENIHQPWLDFSIHKAMNLLGEEIEDVGGAMQNYYAKILPLLRTNSVNLHPIAAAVYHHLFYHHGAGSRDFQFRILIRYDYYKHWLTNYDREKLCERLMNELMSDPERFIHYLMYEEK